MKKVVIATISSIFGKVDLNPELYDDGQVIIPLDALETVNGLDPHKLNYHPSCWAYFTVHENHGVKEWVLIIKRGMTTYWVPQGNVIKADSPPVKEIKEGPLLKVIGNFEHFVLRHALYIGGLMSAQEIFDTRQTDPKENHVSKTSPTSFQ